MQRQVNKIYGNAMPYKTPSGRESGPAARALPLPGRWRGGNEKCSTIIQWVYSKVPIGWVVLPWSSIYSFFVITQADYSKDIFQKREVPSLPSMRAVDFENPFHRCLWLRYVKQHNNKVLQHNNTGRE